ncbi:hypothetical protein LTR16_004223, partial [Cryomyces antarcticus]
TSLNAFTVVSGNAMKRAAELDEHYEKTKELAGPLHGIPIVVKDQIETADMITSFGSQEATKYLPSRDAHLVTKLREAGAVILGKSTMPDWAASWFSTSSLSGTTKNPYDLSRESGGSSSGTGAAVAANLALVGIGGDTGGSIRLPSSFCNLVGVRVTPGLISRDGMSALVTPQDTPGPMTRTVEDAARLLDVLVGFDVKDDYSSINVIAASRPGKPSDSPTPFADALHNASLSGKTIGVLRAAFGTHAGMQALLSSTLSHFSDAGATLTDVSIPDLEHYKAYTSQYGTRSKGDIDAFLASRADSGTLPANIAAVHAGKAFHPALDLVDVIVNNAPPDHGKLLAQAQFQRLVATAFARDGLDALVYPTSQVPPPTTQDVLDARWTCLSFPTNTVIASQLLFPAISVPVGFVKAEEGDGNGSGGREVPVGLEVLGLPCGEERILAVAAAVEKLVGARRRPVLGA